MRLPEPRVARLLERWPVARLATTGPQGRPQLVPIVFARLAGELWSPIDGKPKRAGELARERNVRADPRVAVLLDAYGDDWDRLWWIALDARARLVEDAGEPGCRAAAAALRRKYPQYERVPLFAERPRWIAMQIERIRSWCASPEALASEAEH